MALETLPTSTFFEDAPPPLQWSDGPEIPAAEKKFLDYGRNMDRNEQRANEPPAPAAAEFAWSRDDDHSYGLGRDDGFGL
jgi:hypothetical protein